MVNDRSVPDKSAFHEGNFEKLEVNVMHIDLVRNKFLEQYEQGSLTNKICVLNKDIISSYRMGVRLSNHISPNADKFLN